MKEAFNTASYLRQGRGMSLNAINSYSSGEMPARKWAKELDIKV